MHNIAALTIQAEVFAGAYLGDVAKEAAHTAKTLRVNVRFVYNGIGLTVCPDESPESVMERYEKFRQQEAGT